MPKKPIRVTSYNLASQRWHGFDTRAEAQAIVDELNKRKRSAKGRFKVRHDPDWSSRYFVAKERD